MRYIWKKIENRRSLESLPPSPLATEISSIDYVGYEAAPLV